MKKKWLYLVWRFFSFWSGKTFKIMKISVFLFLAGIISMYAGNSYSQTTRLSLDLRETTVGEVLTKIEDQSEFYFLYSNKLVDVNRKVSLRAKNKPVSNILDHLFADTDVRYVVFDRQIILSQKEMLEKTIKQLNKLPQEIVVTGKVTDEDGNPLPGVNIIIKGTLTGTITDVDGNYSIEVDDPNATLLFSFIGYRAQEVEISGRKLINITLAEEAFGLDEVVTIGYGTQKKVNMTGAVNTVSSQIVANRTAGNVVNALQGVAPNLNITTNNSGGEMGATMNMNIRGIGSINGGGGSPYVLVDGVEQSLNTLNPDDIESISVLKDAAASAIYGARAAFGVILVTTKHGISDGVRITYSNQFSFAKAIHTPSVANSLDWAAYHNEGAKNDGRGEYATFKKETIDKMAQWQAGEIPSNEWTAPNPDNPLYWLAYNKAWGNTDWYKELYRPWVSSPTHKFSVSGGDEKSQFYISASTMEQQGLLRIGDDTYKKRNVSAKVNTEVFDWLRFEFSSRFSGIALNRPSYNPNTVYNNIARMWPTQALYDPDGSMSDRTVQIYLEQGGRYKKNTNGFLLIPGIEIEPVKGWVIYGNYRFRLNTMGNTNHVAKVAGTNVLGDPNIKVAQNSISSYMYKGYYNSPNLYSTFTKTLESHNFVVMAGFEQELYTYRSTGAKKLDLITDLVPSINAATGQEYASGSEGHWSTKSFFGRFNYNYLEKYLLEVSARRDGSSKFAKGYRWGTFSSASAGYVISKEPFWDPIRQHVNLLKFRGSYGILGNQNVDNYLYLDRLPINTNLKYIFGTERPIYAGMAGLSSPNITWEKVRTSNIGFDAGFLDNRLTFSADFYNRETYHMLGPVESLPAVLGTGVPQTNNATLETKGFEVVVGYRDNFGDIGFNVNFMLSDAHSVITKYYNPSLLLSSPYYEGKKLGEIWGYTTVGLFQSDAEADGWVDQTYLSNYPLTAGDVKYADINGDGKINRGTNSLNDPGDLSIIGNSSPRYSYSTSMNVTWKGFDFNMLWQGVGKKDLALTSYLFWGATNGKWNSTCFEEHLDYWTPENTDAYYPKVYYDKGSKNHQIQSGYLQNGAYLRLKFVQLGYTLPSSLTKKVFIENLKVFVSGENLLTFTKLIKIFDPELTGGNWGNGKAYPLQKYFSCGLNVTF